MKRIMLPVILFIILVLEGLANDFLPFMFKASEFLFVSHWVLIFLVLTVLFLDEKDAVYAISYGVAFGLLIDIIYTGVLGVYMFVYPFSLYVVHLLKRLLQTNFLMSIIIVAICIFVTEVLLFFIYSLVGIIEMSISSFFVYRFFTTLIANLLFLMLIYYTTKKSLKWMKTNN